MHRTPSNADIQRLVIDLCRASATLRIAEERGMLSGDGESGRLAQGIEDWLTVCERQIAPILDETSAPATQAANVIDLSQKRAARTAVATPPTGKLATPPPEPEKAPTERNWAELRAQLRSISVAMTKA